MNAATFVNALGGGGILVAVIAAIVAVYQAHTRKGESRAHAADLLARGYGGFTDRLEKSNDRLAIDNARLRKALIEITDMVDELLAQTETCGGCRDFRTRIKEKNNAAKLLS